MKKSYENRLITAHDAVELLKAEVDRKGEDYVYEEPPGPGCSYTVHDRDTFSATDTPSCIVGHVFVHLGLDMSREDGLPIEGPLDHVIEQFKKANPALRMTKAALIVLRTAQSLQDRGETWGLALKAAAAVEDSLPRELDFDEVGV